MKDSYKKNNKSYRKKNKTYKKNYKDKSKDSKFSSLDLIDKRIIYLDGEINSTSSKDIICNLIKLDMINHKDITIYLNSTGGSVNNGLAIIDVMNMIKSDVSVVCVGMCASMACVLLACGTKGKRYMLPNSEIMIHEVSTVSMGKITEMQDKLDHATKINNKICKILSEKTNKSYSSIKKDINRKDSWINATNALKQGFVDKILY